MEVDDAVTKASSISQGVQESNAAEEEESNGGPPRENSLDIQKKPVDNGETVAGSDSTATSSKRKSGILPQESPFKLRLTSDEEFSDYDAAQGVKALKRKRFKLRRSGSKECLLGFNEESGEAELVKDDEMMEILDGTISPTSSPRQKRFKKSPPTAKSPKTPPGSSGKITKAEQPTKTAALEKPLKHVVGDNEDAGNEPSPKKGQTSVANSTTKKPTETDADYYKKPFEYGWKRELVWRTNLDSKADVYFITPGGKKLRSRSDIIPLLEGDLTIDHFSFVREPLGVGPELELVRHSKPSNRVSATAATLAAATATTPTSMGKRVSKPKGPKGASPPPEGWTPARALKVNNAALHSGTSASKQNSTTTNAPAPTPSISRHNSSGNTSGGAAVSKQNSGGSSKSKKNSAASNVESLKTTQKSHSTSLIAATTTNIPTPGIAHEPCTYNCPLSSGKLPQLQCSKCLCLYHHECVGLNPGNNEYRSLDGNRSGRDYVCETCNPKPPPQPAVQSLAPVVSSPARSSQQKAANSARSPRGDNKLPQTITVVKGKKYVMVTKQNAAPSASQQVNDIENDLRQIKEGIQHTHRKTASGSSVDSAVTATAVERSNKLFAANFFANVSYAYDALVCILKYLKIHERSRAASVCRLWHLAAKDTSLWQTVRMKNSKVCNWSGFAAALRRGETKHLDLRKMLLPSGRSDDMWQGFIENVGTVCSLEIIDLCRCPARVVESLFESNRRLRILNAVAINDDTLNLENLALMTTLKELRLRTCEPSVIAVDLQPLRALTSLTHLSLTAVRGLGDKGIEVFAELRSLTCLELGECGDFDVAFAKNVLPNLVNLQRLRLENGSDTACCTLSILDAVAQLKQLTQLELVNFDIKPGFDERLCQCISLRKLLIIPTYISQSATTNHIVLSAVQQTASTLQVFTWGVTVELLRVTALYVDQCDDSTKKKKHHFDECIPVLKPVPGAPPTEDDENTKQARPQETASDVPQIEILPLEKVETILKENLPQTKFTIVKVPYIATGKQQLVE